MRAHRKRNLGAAGGCRLPSCNRPCHYDRVTGITHDFCGRTHATQFAAMHNEDLAPPHGACHVCKLAGCNEPVCFDAALGRVHDFCCKAHAVEAIEKGEHPASLKSVQYGQQIDPAHCCTLPGCTARKFVDPDTHTVHDYCGRSHARTAASRGLRPPPQALGAPAHFAVTFSGRRCTRGCCSADGECGDCEPDYTLSTLTNAHPKYETIKAQFANSWAAAAGPRPTVIRVLQVRNPIRVFERYEAYKRELATAGRDPNEQRRFHATGSTCNFGVAQSQAPCEDAACAVCSIAASGFQLRHAGGGALSPAFGFLRYGRGLYFSRTSSKSNDYGAGSERSHGGANHRVMFLCKVALGKVLRSPEEWLDEAAINRAIGGRGQGGQCDSVLGLTKAEGGSLNNEENVVYAEAAALPSYLVVYKF